MSWKGVIGQGTVCKFHHNTDRISCIQPSAEQLSWLHWMNNFTTTAQGRNAVATAAVSPRGMCDPWFAVPQTCCLAGAGAINAA